MKSPTKLTRNQVVEARISKAMKSFLGFCTIDTKEVQRLIGSHQNADSFRYNLAYDLREAGYFVDRSPKSESALMVYTF